MREPEDDAWRPGPAWLFCPADRPDRVVNAHGGSDVVIVDLEDAVAPGNKEAARTSLRGLIADGALDKDRTVVRINGAETSYFSDDVRLVAELALPRIMLSKAEHPGQLAELDCDVIALVETAHGIEWVGALAEQSQVIGLMWGADDLVASIGGTASRRVDGGYRDIARYARARTLIAAKSCGLLALDAVYMDIADTSGLAAESEDAAASGFDVKAAIHPSQLATIRAAYRPSDDRLEWARRLLEHIGENRGVATFEGRMVDGPIYKQAERMIRLAARTATIEGGR